VRQRGLSRGQRRHLLRTREYTSSEDILRDADIAMYRAKETGRPYMIFDRKSTRRSWRP
jgi:GGDEF domain-containing protein